MDGSKNSLRGLKFALGIAEQSGASVLGLNICLPPIPATSAVGQKTRQKNQEIVKQAERISQKYGVSFTVMVKVSNNIGKAIVTFAENNKVDMIVIGSRGPDPEVELFFGSVANYVFNKSKIPVTIVK